MGCGSVVSRPPQSRYEATDSENSLETNDLKPPLLEACVHPPRTQRPYLDIQIPRGLPQHVEDEFIKRVCHFESKWEHQQKIFQHQQLALGQLDEQTKIPHLLVELRSLGYVEISGKDVGGIYRRLGQWLHKEFACHYSPYAMREYPVVKDSEHGSFCGTDFRMVEAEAWEIFCDAKYVCGEEHITGKVHGNMLFQTRGRQGENNMGVLSMAVIDFMTNTCGWSLNLCNGLSFGFESQIREQQLLFTAPHPLNLVSTHMMVELRQAGYIEIIGPHFSELDDWLIKCWHAKRTKADPLYCDNKYTCNAFQRGKATRSNMSVLSAELINFMVYECKWTLLTCNCGNFGDKGVYREQQLVFRNDSYVNAGENHVLVELSEFGHIEISGFAEAVDLHRPFEDFLTNSWGFNKCAKGSSARAGNQTYENSSFFLRDDTMSAIGKRTIELAYFMSSQGWMLRVCGGNIAGSSHPRREQQVFFSRAKGTENCDAPLLMIELRAIPADAHGKCDCFIMLSGLDVSNIYVKLTSFFQHTMLATPHGQTRFCDLLFSCGCLSLRDSSTDPNDWAKHGRLCGENNFGKYTMRICDFMVDHVNEWDLLACNGNSIDYGFGDGPSLVVVRSREQQLLFRQRQSSRAALIGDQSVVRPLGRQPLDPPFCWSQDSRDGRSAHEMVPASHKELQWMQELLDGTYKKKATRDRTVTLASRFIVVTALRSEQPFLWDRYAVRRRNVVEDARVLGRDIVVPKTLDASSGLASEYLQYNAEFPAMEAYLLHGTSPTSALAILKTSFKLDLAGKSAGTMFGAGIYLAEASTKADEYAKDEKTGSTYDGLYAMLVCRSVLGRAYVVEQAGDYRDVCNKGRYGVLVGDRENAVGTYREFVFFDEGSVYPEYVVMYRRELESAS